MIFRRFLNRRVKTELEDGIVVHVPAKKSSLTDIASYINRYIRSWSEFHTLWDFRHFNFDTLDYSSVSSFVRLIEDSAEMRSNLKSAILVESNVAYGFSHMFKTLAGGREIQVELNIFSDKQQAMDWLRSEQVIEDEAASV